MIIISLYKLINHVQNEDKVPRMALKNFLSPFLIFINYEPIPTVGLGHCNTTCHITFHSTVNPLSALIKTILSFFLFDTRN